MNSIFKPFEEQDTSLEADRFSHAVFRLTIYYTLGVCILLIGFSTLVYAIFSTHIGTIIDDDTGRELATRAIQNESLSHEIVEHLGNVLIVADIVLVFVAFGISYMLAHRTLRPLRIAYQRQRRFVADAAHELRTPLSVLKAGSELILQQKREVPAYVKFVGESKEEIDRLIRISNDLLFLAQRVDGHGPVHEEFSLSDICEQQSCFLRSYAERRRVTVSADIQRDVRILGNADDMSRALLNMLKNAVDYNTEGGTVTLRLTRRDQRTIISVIDTGMGIPEKDIPHIFERFYKVDVSRTQQLTSGSGLGLSIVSDIIRQHRGTISCHSTLGKGSTFVLDLPCV